ncbi:MAG: FAD-binding protein [Acidobacteria bacterium]|nr:FAD-binding protein [Acidobacteriota bacterium]
MPDFRRLEVFVQNGLSILKKDLRGIQENGEPEIHERVDLRAWTVLGVGGLADLLIRCRSADGLQRALDVLATHGERWLVLGAGSRLVPSDRGLRIPVLNLSGNLGLWELDLDGAVAGGGANLAQVCRAAARTGMNGTGNLMLSRSSVGGAVHALVHGQRPLGGIVDWIDLARPGHPNERVYLSDRRRDGEAPAVSLERRVLVRARMQLVCDSLRRESAKHFVRGRHAGQRQPRTAEPLFMDPPDGSAEAHVAAAGCSDLRVRGARLSRTHGNRICTSKAARAEDVLDLTRLVKDRVAQHTGVVLETALCFVDDDGRAISP